jgi:flagellin-like hook-associated protein FlgL
MGSKSDSDGEVGAVGYRLLTASNNLGVEIESLIASESTLVDTDLAAEITTLQQGLLGFQTSIQSLANQLQFENRAQGRLLDTLS